MFATQSYEKECEEHIEEEGCAGIVATGNVVKDGRSILWKNRHSSSSEDNKVWYEEGTNYSYIRITDLIGCWMGTNEEGLSIANFRIDNDEGDLNNGHSAPGPNNVGSSDAMASVLGNYSTLADAIDYLIAYASGDSEGTQFILISSEPGVGAIVAMDPQSPNNQYNVTWVNNSWIAVDNGFYCDDDNDPDENRDRIAVLINDIRDNSTSSEGDNLINWKDVAQRCAKDVSDKEQGWGTFSTVGEIAKDTSLSALITVAGNNSFNNSNHMTFLALGDHQMVGLFVPVAVAALNSQDDIPLRLWRGDGFNVTQAVKYTYANTGSPNTFYCDRVQEIQTYANSNENFTFQQYDELADTIGDCASEAACENKLLNFAQYTADMTMYNYEHNISFAERESNVNKFAYYKNITINSSMIPSNQQNFPVLVLNTSSDFANHAQSDGDDFIFAHNEQVLNHEVVDYDSSTGALQAYVNVSQINASDNVTIQIYYGNPAVGPQQNVTGTWDHDYVVVHHYEDDLMDSTRHAYHGTDSYGSVTKEVTGQSGDAVEISESADSQIRITDYEDYSDAFTTELWIYRASSTTESVPRIFTEGGGYTINDWCLYMRDTTNEQFRVMLNGNTVDTEGNRPPDDCWWYTALRWQDATDDLDVYVNTTLQLSSTLSENIGDSYDYLAIANDGGGGNTWDGYIDELRISKTTRSADWLETSYNNLADPTSFFSFGSEQSTEVPPENSNPSPANGAIEVPYNPVLSITVTDGNEDHINTTFRTNVSGTWQDIGTNTSVISGTTLSHQSTNMNTSETTYWWSVNSSDDEGQWDNDAYSFTTQKDLTPQLSNPVPADGAQNISVPYFFNITAETPDGSLMNITLRTNATGGWHNMNGEAGPTHANATNGTYNITSWLFTEYNTTYWWSVNATNANGWTNETYTFHIGPEPNHSPERERVYPRHYSVNNPLNVSLMVDLSDKENDTMNIYWYTNASGSWEQFATNLSVSPGVYTQPFNTSAWGEYVWWSVNITNTDHWSNTSKTYRNEFEEEIIWWNINWTQSIKLETNSSLINKNLTKFPLLVHITDSDLAQYAQSDGDDIIFVAEDNATIYQHELISFDDATGELWAWVNIHDLAELENIPFYLYFGNPSCTAQEQPEDTWNENYVLVLHFDDNSLADSTRYDHSVTNSETTYTADGVVGGARQHYQSPYYTKVTVNDFYDLGQDDEVTAEIWIYVDNTYREFLRVFMEGWTWNSCDWGMYLRDYANENYRVMVDSGTTGEGGNRPPNDCWWYSASVISDYYDYVEVRENATVEMHNEFLGRIDRNRYDYLYIGNDWGFNSWDGYFDEVRISNTVRSKEWTDVAYHNQLYPEHYVSIVEKSEVKYTMSLTCNQTDWNITGATGSHHSTATYWANITNTGNIEIDVEISATNGTIWTAGSATGHNTFNLSFNAGNGWNVFTWDKKEFLLNLESGQTKQFGLQVYLPTSASTTANQSTIITYTVTPEGSASDCADTQSELHTANTANNAYYVDYAEFAPNLSALSDYGYTPSELSTGYLQYNRSANGQEAGYWEATARPVPCDCDEDVGRWTQTGSTGQKVWRNNTELQSWKNSLGI